MKNTLFLFAVFFAIIVSGCSSASDRPVPQQQNYEVTARAAQQNFEVTGGRQTGQVLQMGNTIGIANTGWPGATSDSDKGITLLNVKTPVKRGEYGSLSIQGVPNTNYTAAATYVNSSGTTTAYVARRSGDDGMVSWTWKVKGDTLPGTYRIVVSGGGKMITAAYTVH